MQTKYRLGCVDRVERSGCAIVRDMFKRETDFALFKGRPVVAATGARGCIVGPFGQAGKVRVEIAPGSGAVAKGDDIAMVTRKYVFA